MSESEDGSKGFKVTDRRKFTADGRARPEAEESAQHEARAEQTASEQTEARPAPESRKPRDTEAAQGPAGARPGAPPKVAFMDLVNMLATNALVQLGDVPDPVSGKQVKNLEGVQVMIAFLEMLQEKTRGNLDAKEDKVLDDVLYDLRMRFMAKTNIIQT